MATDEPIMQIIVLDAGTINASSRLTPLFFAQLSFALVAVQTISWADCEDLTNWTPRELAKMKIEKPAAARDKSWQASRRQEWRANQKRHSR